jgi:uncharacterized protein
MTNDATPEIADHAERHRYELALGGKLAAHIDYRMRGGDTIDLIHTEVATEHEGKGLGSQIARHALDDARSRGLKVIASCSYIAGYVRKHPEYGGLLAQR